MKNFDFAGVRGSRKFANSIRNLPGALYIFVVLFLAFMIVIPNFASLGNILTYFQQASILVILSAGMSLTIMTGGIDMSVGGAVSAIGVLMVLLMNKGVSEPLAILAGLLSAVLIGLVNGLVIVRLKVTPFIATFGMMGVGQGLANLLSGERALYLPSNSQFPVITFLQQDFFGMDFSVVVTLVIILLLIFLFNRTTLRAHLYALGGNREAAKLSNINIKALEVFVYIISGLLAGVAAVLMLSRLNSAQPTAGDGLEFQAGVAAVLGGNALIGGKGSVMGAVLGALVVYIVQNGLTLAGYNSNVVMVILGIILITGVVINNVSENLANRKGVQRVKEGGAA